MIAAIAALRHQTSTWLPPIPLPWQWGGTFARKFTVDFSVRGYRVKTIETSRELGQVLNLRRSVFHFEFAKKWISLKSDRDEFDDVADHLAIFDEERGRIAGVYRLISSRVSDKFYSATEFDIGGILALSGNKVELSRACINREYRNGVVISLLWRGIAEYAKAAEAETLFGLSSVSTIDPLEAARLTRHFQAQGLIDDAIAAPPRAKYAITEFDRFLERAAEGPEDGVAQRVPSLMKSYIKAGAKLCSLPVIDRDFHCVDFLTVLDLRRMVGAFGRRYG